MSRIAIIGAGVSGFAAAVRLVEQGLTDITIFEARKVAGGRTRSYIDTTTGDLLDNGQHLMMGCYTSTLDYIRRIGTRHLLHLERNLTIPFYDGRSEKPKVLSLPPLPAPLHLIAGLLRTNLLTRSDKIAALRIGNAIRKNNLPDTLPSITCAELFDAFNQPEHLIAALWEPVVLATINARIREASALLFVSVLREAFFKSAIGSALLFPTVGLSELLIRPVESILSQAGVEFRYSAPVRTLKFTNRIIEIATDKSTDAFDFVIWSAPDFTPLPQEITGNDTSTSASPIVNAYFWIDKNVLNSPIAGILGTTLQWVFPKTTTFAGQRLALTVSAAHELSTKPSDEIAELLWLDLQRSIPAISKTQLVHRQIIREKRATPLFTPDLQQRRFTSETHYENFFLAGDFVQNGLPATIEGAVRNGYSAASKLLRRLKA